MFMKIKNNNKMNKIGVIGVNINASWEPNLGNIRYGNIDMQRNIIKLFRRNGMNCKVDNAIIMAAGICNL